MPTVVGPVAVMASDAAPASQDQVLRNHAVGSTCSTSASGPALVTSTVISRSSGPAFA